MPTVVQIDAWDPVAGGLVALCAASHDHPEICHLGGGTWWPVIAKLPTLRYDLFDGAFAGQIVAPSSTIALQTEPWPSFGRYILADARIRLWHGSFGDPAANYVLRFDGRIGAQPTLQDGRAEIDFAVDDRWLDTALLTLYAGTGGAEGTAALKGQAKPLALGAPRYVPGKLVDSVNSVFQVSAYGPIQGFEAALEKLVRYPAPLGDYADYASLVAAQIPAGQWATAKAVGMARFGAPPTGQISFLLQGDAAGTDGWVRTPGKMVRRLAILSGGMGKLDDSSLNALDAVRPYYVSIYCETQTTARELIQKLAASVNAVAGVSWTGQLFVAPIAVGATTTVLAADGTSLPPVASVQQIDMASPYQKLAINAERAWTVHELSDIAFTASVVDLGLYASGTSYREGNIANLVDGSRWLFVATTPATGSVPAAGNANWYRLTGPTAAVYGDGTPIEVLKPAQAGADKTSTNTARYLYGQGSLATLDSLAYGSSQLSGFGDLAQRTYVRLGGPVGTSYAGFFNEAGTQYVDDNMAITSRGTAAYFYGQGAFAVLSQIDLTNSDRFTYGGRFAGLRNGDGGFFRADRIVYDRDDGYGGSYQSLASLRPQEIGSNVTESRTARFLYGQGIFATAGNLDLDNATFFTQAQRFQPIANGDSRFFRAENMLYAADGNTVAGLKPQEAGANVTEGRTARYLYGQGAFATVSQVDLTNSDRFTFGGRFAGLRNGDGGFFRADRVVYDRDDGYGGSYQSLASLRPQEIGSNVTESRTARFLYGQGIFATAGNLNLDNATFFTQAQRFQPIANGDSRFFRAENMLYAADGNTVAGLKPQEAGANVTETRTSQYVMGQTGWVTFTGLSPVQVTVKVSLLDASSGRALDSRILPTNVLTGVKVTVSDIATAADQGGSSGATISVPQHTRTFASTTGQQIAVTYNSGSIPNRAYSTVYFVYADDPSLAGGSVTYSTTTSPNDLVYLGRVHIATVVTPAQGATATAGSAGSGSSTQPASGGSMSDGSGSAGGGSVSSGPRTGKGTSIP